MTLKTVKSPAMPRRLSASPAAADAMSSVTMTFSTRMPSAASRSVARPKFITSPA